jgi:hypothetical protein
MFEVDWMKGANFSEEVWNFSYQFILLANFGMQSNAHVGRFSHDRRTFLNNARRLS